MPTNRNHARTRRRLEAMGIDVDAALARGWTMEFLDLIGSFDEDIPRYPQQPITELKDPFEGWDDDEPAER